MQPWKSILAYDGTAFHGWQVQPGLPTVQGTLAAALRHITGETVLPQGSGRTDAGVHALGQVASFALAARIPPVNLLRALNRVLPPAIRVLSAEHAPEGFHARHSAVRKTYVYRIFPRHRRCQAGVEDVQPERVCPPMLAPYAWDYRYPFDLDAARQAAAHVLGEHDFSSFAASDPDRETRRQPEREPGEETERSNMRRIFHSDWTVERGSEGSPGQEPLMVYRVTGSGFLHHMVRNLAGTFCDAASGRLAPEAVPEILAARNRAAAGPTAPAHGLFLLEVEY